MSKDDKISKQSQTVDDAAPILVPAHLQRWTFGDHLRHLAGHAGIEPLQSTSMIAVWSACAAAGSGRMADRMPDDTKPDEPVPFLVEVTVNGIKVTVTLMLKPGMTVMREREPEPPKPPTPQ